MSRLRELTPAEQEALYSRTGDPLTSALRGFHTALKGTGDTIAHPVQTGQALVSALRNPKKTATETFGQLKSDFQRDPIEAAVANLFPMPTPGGSAAGKLRSIIMPQNMARPDEKKFIRQARDEFEGNDRLRQDFLEAAMYRDVPHAGDAAIDIARVQDQFASAYDGWYPGIDTRMRKEFPPPEIDVDVLMDPRRSRHLPVGTPSPKRAPLHAMLRDVDLKTRIEAQLVKEKMNWPVVVRNKTMPGGSWDAGINTMDIGGDMMSDVVNTFDHETQHLLQSLGRFGPRNLGENAQSVPWDEYLRNPGEVEARITALRRQMTPEARRLMSQPMQEAMALNWMDRQGHNIRPETLLDTVDEFNRYRNTLGGAQFETLQPGQTADLVEFLRSMRGGF